MAQRPPASPQLTLSRVDVVAAPRFPRRFGARVFLYVVALSIGTAAASVGIYYWLQLGFLEREQARRASTLLTALATQSELGAYAGDASLCDLAARRIFADDDVVVAAVYDRAGREIIRFSHADASPPFPPPEVFMRLADRPDAAPIRFRIVPKSGESFDDLYAPIVTLSRDPDEAYTVGARRSLAERREVVGAARIGLSLRPARQQLVEMLRWGGLLGFGIFATGILAALLISRRVSQPIRALIQGADRIRSGELDTRVKISSRDEVGQLAYSFNRMARRLNESITALETLNRDLEAEVQRRTVEIQRAADFSSLLNAPLGQQDAPIEAVGKESSGPVRGGGPQPIVGGNAEGTLARLLDGVLSALVAGTGTRAAAVLLTTRAGAGATPESAAPPLAEGGLALARYRGAQPDQFGATPPLELLREGPPFLYGPRTIVPLLLGAQIEGCLVLVDLEPRDDVLRFVGQASSQLAIAVSNVRAYAAADELTHALRERNEALAQQRDQLQQVNRLKSEFLANISHELRTPLNAIIGYCELISEGIYGSVNEKQLRALAGIDESGQNLLGLINQILDLARMEAGKMTVNVDEADVVAIARAVVAEAEPLAKDRPYQVVLDSEPVPRVRTDAAKVKQIVTNLVSNAVKFTASGRVTVRVRPDAAGGCTIAVKDTGIGIKPEDMKIIFEEFRQVDGSYTREFGGSGLGLSIASRFADMVGGRLSVESSVGVGSTFTLTLPAETPRTVDTAPVGRRRTHPPGAFSFSGAGKRS